MPSLKKNFVYNALFSLSNVVFPLIVFPYVSRVLGPKGVGEAMFAYDYAQYFLVIAALGISSYGAREIAQAKPGNITQPLNELFSIQLISSTLFGVIYLCSILYLPVFKENIDLHLLGSLLVFSGFLNLDWYFIGQQDFKYISLRTFLTRGLSVLFVFTFVQNIDDQRFYFIGILLFMMLNGLFNGAAIYRKHPLKWGLNNKTKNRLRAMLFISGTSLASLSYTLLDTVILGFLSSKESVAYYAISVKISKIPLMAISSFSVVMMPKISSIIASNQDVRPLVEKSLNLLLILAVPTAIGIYTISDLLILTLSGPDFKPAISCLKIMSVIPVVLSINYFLVLQILTPRRRDKHMMICMILGVVANIILSLLLVPKLSHIGTAIATVLTEVFVCLLLFIFSYKYININFPIKLFFIILTSCLPFYFINLFARNLFPNNILIIMLVVLLSISTYFILLLFFKVGLVLDAIDQIKGYVLARKRKLNQSKQR